ncbi:DivIVA domain-containing protein [Lutispora saccharofermentans]|uniref:DivIVA domain-containing protein n=1 Tax=Lutispora saccharofermentans TaxID=3024236 RepID=A0ABT1NA07_9FIRM|nr:DivIVA domain-containing protein [Lutispora saccharofermentans]MCQ1528085.1 DivIVA domain-containing protein [Lutispora saccharofermentans]
MMTPMDIRNKEFKKGFRGYSEEEVDIFIDKVVNDYEKLYRENSELKDKLNSINERLESYSEIEKTLQNTLIIAQKTSEDIIANARKEAEIIIRESDENKRKIIDDANQNVIKVNKEYEEMRKQLQIFKTRYKTFLESELNNLDSYFKEI